MLQIKRAIVLVTPLAFLCAVAAAQNQPQPDDATKSTATSSIKTQPQTPQTVKAHRPQKLAAAPNVSNSGPSDKAPPVPGAGVNALPTACVTPTYAVPPGDVYGPYVPYVPPPTACPTPVTPAAPSNPSSANSSTVQKQPAPESVIKSAPTDLIKPADLALAPAAPPPPPVEIPAEGAYVRPVPTQRAPTIDPELRPFRSWAIGFRASTLGLGVEFATPLAGRINLRSSFNLFAFNDPYSMDGLNYDARMHLQSSQTTLDWFVGKFHISPGFLYLKNAMSAQVFVGPGKTFVLGTQTFLNSVDDPVTGSSYVIFPRTIAPLLLFGYGNLLPRHGEHLSLPVEAGVAYTGAAQINVDLNGTACVTNGCVNFSQNADAQKFLKQEINILNEDLKHYPVFPIVSVGLAYRF